MQEDNEVAHSDTKLTNAARVEDESLVTSWNLDSSAEACKISVWKGLETVRLRSPDRRYHRNLSPKFRFYSMDVHPQ